jgi:hypothetical protein
MQHTTDGERANAAEVPAPAPRGGWPLAVAIAVNLVPIVGVVFWGWSAFALIFLYWMENIVIGVRTLLSMLASALISGTAGVAAFLFFGAFFTVHYGLFCLGHGAFVVSMFGDAALGSNMFDLVGATRTVLAQQPNILIGLASISLWQLVQLVLFVVRGEAAKSNLLELMSAPYGRIIILHLAIIFGGFLLMMMSEPMAGLVVLALVKTWFDVAEARGQVPRFMRTQPAQAS